MVCFSFLGCLLLVLVVVVVVMVVVVLVVDVMVVLEPSQCFLQSLEQAHILQNGSNLKSWHAPSWHHCRYQQSCVGCASPKQELGLHQKDTLLVLPMQ